MGYYPDIFDISKLFHRFAGREKQGELEGKDSSCHIGGDISPDFDLFQILRLYCR